MKPEISLQGWKWFIENDNLGKLEQSLEWRIFYMNHLSHAVGGDFTVYIPVVMFQIKDYCKVTNKLH